jgi:hypothetical protein
MTEIGSMATVLKAGARFKSAVSDAQLMVVKAPPGEHELHCGGTAMLSATAPAPEGASLDPALAGEVLIGKRYVTADESLELLCTKAGKGLLSLDGAPLEVKQAKQLPSSD